MTSRIIVVREYDEAANEIDAAIVVQDDNNETVVYGKDKVIKKSVERKLINGATLDDILKDYDRPPHMWTVEMNDTRYEYGTDDA